MKRKDENKIVVRTQRGMAILMWMYSILLVTFTISAVIVEAPITAICISIAMLIITTTVGIAYFKKCEILYLTRIDIGRIITIKNEHGEIFDLELNKLKYKIFEKQYHILLQDANHTVLLSKSKKMLYALKEIGVINDKKEL